MLIYRLVSVVGSMFHNDWLIQAVWLVILVILHAGVQRGHYNLTLITVHCGLRSCQRCLPFTTPTFSLCGICFVDLIMIHCMFMYVYYGDYLSQQNHTRSSKSSAILAKSSCRNVCYRWTVELMVMMMWCVCIPQVLCRHHTLGKP